MTNCFSTSKGRKQSPKIFLDVGRRDERGSRSGQIDLKAETNSVLSFRVSGGGGLYSLPHPPIWKPQPRLIETAVEAS